LDFDREIMGKKDRHGRVHPDPAASLTHTQLAEWPGFASPHALRAVSMKTVEALKMALPARDNLIYRPYMLIQPDKRLALFFEDCSLQYLLANLPDSTEVDGLYVEFLESVGDWDGRVYSDQAKEFLSLLLTTIDDVRKNLPPLGLVSRYAAVLHGHRQPAKPIRLISRTNG
jgi:hypothetical protein